MVLHDNKWDKKAKQAYNRKHGIVTPKPVKKTLPKDHWKYESDEPENPIPQSSADSSEENDGAQAPVVEPSAPESRPMMQAMELPSLPDMAEQSAEEKALIAQRIAKLAGTQQKQYRPHVSVVKDAAEFDQISSNVEHTRLTRDMRRRFGKAKPGELEEDEDFEAFMENPVVSKSSRSLNTAGKVVVDEDKQRFIDSLLR